MKGRTLILAAVAMLAVGGNSSPQPSADPTSCTLPKAREGLSSPRVRPRRSSFVRRTASIGLRRTPASSPRPRVTRDICRATGSQGCRSPRMTGYQQIPGGPHRSPLPRRAPAPTSEPVRRKSRSEVPAGLTLPPSLQGRQTPDHELRALLRGERPVCRDRSGVLDGHLGRLRPSRSLPGPSRSRISPTEATKPAGPTRAQHRRVLGTPTDTALGHGLGRLPRHRRRHDLPPDDQSGDLAFSCRGPATSFRLRRSGENRVRLKPGRSAS